MVLLPYWHQTMFRYQVGGGHIATKRRKKDWEGGFLKRRLKFVFITGAWYLSTFLLISWRYSVWFDLFVFATLKFVELRKNIQKRWRVGSLNWKSKQHPLNSTWKNAHVGDYRRQTMRQVSYKESFFDLQQTFRTRYFNGWIVLSTGYIRSNNQPMDNAIGFPGILPLDSGCLGCKASITIEKVGPDHQMKNESTERNFVYSHLAD